MAMDIGTIAVAALPGLLFGGINIYTLLKFSYSLGKYQGEESERRQAVATDIKEIKIDISEIRAETKSAAADFTTQRLELQANSILLKYLQTRDKEIGDRTHKIANLEMAITGLTDHVRNLQNDIQILRRNFEDAMRRQLEDTSKGKA